MKSQKKLFIITGVSSGLGLSLASQLLSRKYHVVGLSRKNPHLENLNFIKTDLSHFDAGQIFKKIQAILNIKSYDEVYIINNAAVIDPINLLGKKKAADIDYHIRVNFTAPVQMINEFIKCFAKYSSRKVICNISSGAADFAIPNWSLYCASKAAINMFTKTMALQLADKKLNTIAIAYSPGIMDTAMQKVIRSKNKNEFPDVARFKRYKKNSELISADHVASHLIQLLMYKKLISGKVYEVQK